MRESAHAKGRRLLCEGRVRVVQADEDAGTLTAEIRGDSAAVYVVSFDTDGWGCTCPTIGRCSHIVAARLIVVLEPRRPS